MFYRIVILDEINETYVQAYNFVEAVKAAEILGLLDKVVSIAPATLVA